jgi:hypothetical protein
MIHLDKIVRPSITPLVNRQFSFLFPKTKIRHFDRSCSQSYREQRSGEIRFSTGVSPSTSLLPLLLPLLLLQKYFKKLAYFSGPN